MDVLDLMNDTNHVGPGYDPTVRPYVCKTANCRKSFARRSDLGRHLRIHTGDRPYACPYHDCGKTFIQNSALTVHIRTHTGEKPHHCETCEKAFADSSSLARHRRIHTGKRPYVCIEKECGRSFARRNTFLKHFKSQHPHLPAPSTNTSRHTVHYPVTADRKLPGALGATSADPRFMLSAPSTSPSSPHGFAALPPPGSAAYSFTGGDARLRGALPFVPYVVGGRVGSGQCGTGVGGGHQSRQQPVHRQPQQQQQQQQQQQPSQQYTSVVETSSQSQSQCHSERSTSGVPTIHTPVSATSSFYEGSVSDYSSPLTALSPESVGLKSVDQNGVYTNNGGTSPDSRTAQGQYGHTVYRSVSVGSLPPPPPGMMWFRSDGTRSLSASAAPRASVPQPYGNLGGFSANQLALPPTQQTHLLPPFFPSTQNQHQHHHSAPSLPPAPAVPSFTVPHIQPLQAQEPMRASSPDLVDISTVPSIALHAPPQSLSVHSAIEPGHSKPFTHPHGQYGNQGSHPYGQPNQHIQRNQHSHTLNAHGSHGQTTVMPGRLHSAPPFLTRFHSSPQVPTLQSGWDKWDNTAPFQGGGQSNSVNPGNSGGNFGNCANAHTGDDGNSALSSSSAGGSCGKEEEWKRMEDEMLSRDIALAPDDAQAPAPAHTPIPSQARGGGYAGDPLSAPLSSAKSLSPNLWGSPIAFSGQPREPTRVFSIASTASSASTVTTPRFSIQTVPSQSYQPNGLVQLQGYGSAPVTPWPTPGYDLDQKPPPPSHQSYMMVQSQPTNINTNTNTVGRTTIPGSATGTTSTGTGINNNNNTAGTTGTGGASGASVAHSADSYFPPMMDLQTITLGSPPRRDPVTTVGLGIANVHFHDRSNAIETEQVYTAEAKALSGFDNQSGEKAEWVMEGGSDEVTGVHGQMERVDEVDEVDGADEDEPASDGFDDLDNDSDDDFIPGRSVGRRRKQGGIKKRGRGWAVRPRRR